MSASLSNYEETLMLTGACGAILRLAQTYKPHPLPGDRPHYAPDKTATVRHIKLEITLDVPNKSISGLCSTTLIPQLTLVWLRGVRRGGDVGRVRGPGRGDTPALRA